MDNNGISILSNTNSSQQLISLSNPDNMPANNTEDNSSSHQLNPRIHQRRVVTRTQFFTVSVLCFVNLINYMDRFTIAGILDDVQKDFNIGDDSAGLLQTAFIMSFMIFAPLFGYLGDRYSRRWIMFCGVVLWSATTLLGSFMKSFSWFIVFRGFVGIGEASYSTIAPTIISDLFAKGLRSQMLALFYFAIPVGSGLGYIAGSETAKLANNWRWALRVTPILGLAAALLLLLLKDPKRGESEGAHNLPTTSYIEDLKYLCRNTSFMLSTAGFTCVAFVTGALAWWGPKFIYLAFRMQPGNENLTINDVALKFGVIAMTAGILGVPLGILLSQKLKKYLASIDPIICGIGLLISAPLMTGAIIIVSQREIATYVLIFFAQLTLNLNWAIVADILLYVVVPTRRSTAEAFQILISHALGDAGSPYFVGLLSEAIKKRLRNKSNLESVTLNHSSIVDGLQSLSLLDGNFNSTTTTTVRATVASTISDLAEAIADTNLSKFKALQYALFSTCFVEVLGAVFFLITAAFIVRDRNKAAGNASENTPTIAHHTADNID